MPNQHPLRLAIEHISVDELKPDPKNPRQHTDRQIGQIAASLKQFGFISPIVVDDAGNILAGHGRVLGAKRLGWGEVPAIRASHMTRVEARAFALADNRLTENSTWDNRLLGEIFLELSAANLDFHLEITGFPVAEIDLRIEGLTSIGPDDTADQVSAPTNGPPVTRLGDLWVLGRHRLLCGNSLEQSSYRSLMNGAVAQLVFTDPPYNVVIDGHATGKGSVRHREFAMASGEMSAGQFTHFLTCAMHCLAGHSADGSLHYFCIDWRHLGEMHDAGAQVYSSLKNLCVWVKDNAGMGSLYRSQHELVFVFKNGSAPHRNNVELGRHGRNRTNVWRYPGASTFGRHGEEGNLSAIHPTVKPVALVVDAILDCSARGNIVLDAFLGSGTTLVAAERVGRVCYALELDPRYVDAAIWRWQRHTGDAAIHAETGRRFDDHAALTEVRHD